MTVVAADRRTRYNIGRRKPLLRQIEDQVMLEKLARLIELARSIRMSPSESEEQRRSFAYGNTKIENDRITREMINERAEALKRADE